MSGREDGSKEGIKESRKVGWLLVRIYPCLLILGLLSLY